MGGRSRSSSSTSSTQSTKNYDQRVAVERQGVGIGAGAQVQVTTTDQGAIKGGVKVATTGLDTAKQIVDTGLNSAVDIVDTVTTTFGKAMKDNTAMLNNSIQSDSKKMASLVVKVMGGFAALVAILMTFGGLKK